MPVGEIGKNLQSLLGCDALSKRLKDQFSGLKRAIENAEYEYLNIVLMSFFNLSFIFVVQIVFEWVPSILSIL
jgi:hypothetical protein